MMGYLPGALTFHWDMFLDVLYVADLLSVRKRRQLSVNENLRSVNTKRTLHDYQVGDQILKKRN